MYIKFVYNLLRNFDFKTLFIISIFFSCHPEQLNNPGLIISENEEVPIGWTLEKNENFTISKIKSTGKTLLSSKHPGEIQFSQTLTLDSGDYFLVAKYNVTIDKGDFYIKTDEVKGIKLYFSESNCLRTIFFIPVRSNKQVKVQFGFSEGSIGNVLIDTIMMYKADYKINLGKANKNKIKLIKENLSLSLIQDEKLDQKIDLFAASINSAFLLKSSLESHSSISTYSSDIFKDEFTSYLATYINDDNIRNTYCQKSSLSLDELLRLYQIPTRQLHWQKDCSGFHQFLEYWNASDQLWKIIDPYYGIRYIDENGIYLGFEGIEELVRNNKFTSTNIKQINIGHLYYSEDEILDGWINADLAIHVLNK